MLKAGDADEFVESLKAAIQEDAATIRETDLDRAGGLRTVKVVRRDGTAVLGEQFVDRLTRVVLPTTYSLDSVVAMAVDDGPNQEVVRVEPRYEGEKQVAWVCYLAKRETNVEEPVSKAN